MGTSKKAVIVTDSFAISPKSFDGSIGIHRIYQNYEQVERALRKVISAPISPYGEAYVCELERSGTEGFELTKKITWCYPIAGGRYAWSSHAVQIEVED